MKTKSRLPIWYRVVAVTPSFSMLVLIIASRMGGWDAQGIILFLPVLVVFWPCVLAAIGYSIIILDSDKGYSKADKKCALIALVANSLAVVSIFVAR